MFWKRAGLGVVFACGAILALHLPLAKPLLARIGGCPVGRLTPAAVERAQHVAIRARRGATPAPARPAIGFSLEAATRSDVESWARARAIDCTSSRQGALLKCDRVPAEALAEGGAEALDEIAFGFRLADHKLINLTTLRSGLEAEPARRRFAAISARLSGALGAAPAGRLPAPGWNGEAPAFVSYRFSDYIAEVSSMRLPGRGVVLREHYLSARESAGDRSAN